MITRLLQWWGRRNKSLRLLHELKAEMEEQSRLLRQINNRTKIIVQRMKDVARELDELETEVSENTDVVESAVTLIESLSQQIKDAGTDPARLQALTDKLDANSKKLAAAVVANTNAPDFGDDEG